jgi:hypothetical protein
MFILRKARRTNDWALDLWLLQLSSNSDLNTSPVFANTTDPARLLFK